MRGPLWASLLVHVGLVAALFVIRPPTPIVIGGPESVEVALLDPSQLPRVPSVVPPPPAPKPAVKEPEPLPDEEDGVRIDEPKPRRQPAEPPRETPPQRPQTAQPVTLALPSARIGTTGLSGSVGVDAADFAFTYYLVQVRDRVARNWSPPAGMRAGVTPRATVYFRITRDGRLSDVRLETASGEEFFDRAALRAVQLSEPLPHLPAGYTGSRLGVYFGFEYRQP